MLNIKSVIFFVLSFLISNASEIKTSLKTFTGALEEYQNKRNDIVFLLDESGSVGAEVFQKELLSTELFARILTISSSGNLPAIVTFSSGHVIHLNAISEVRDVNMCSFLPIIQNVPYAGGGTNTARGLRVSGEILQTSIRSDVENKIIFVISDGQSNEGGDPVPVANELKSKGIIIFGIGVAEVNDEELLGLATARQNIYVLNDFNEIQKLNEKIKDDISEKSWDVVDSSHCNSRCDKNAGCFCGSTGGKFQCACLPGYRETETDNECKPCPKGSYSDKPSKRDCNACPINSTTSKEGSKSIKDCFCLLGHEGNPENNSACKPVQCAKLTVPEGGSLIPPNKCGNTFNSSCTFKCKEGYCPYSCERNISLENNERPWDIEPEEPRKCLETRNWSGVEFYCEKIKCSALNFPKDGSHNCSQSDFGFGTVCQMKCDEGYVLHGSVNRQCQSNGKWDGKDTTCKAVQCPVLKTNKLLRVKPKSCFMDKSQLNTVCRYFCKEGYKLVTLKDFSENQDVGIRKCLTNGTWSRSYEKITCKDTIPPSLKCPNDIMKFTDKHKPTGKVTWNPPIVTDNVKVASVKIVNPPKVKNESYSFNIGDNIVTYVASDVSGLNATCSFHVIIKDIEPPRVKNCPKDIVIFHGKNTPISVNWTEPAFEDNSGKIKIDSKYQNRKSGDEFRWGLPAPVYYNVSDPSENSAECRFNVIVKPYACKYEPPPLNGALVCDKWLGGGQFCKVYCEDGYDFIRMPEKEYFCQQLGTHAKWGRLLPNLKNKNQPFVFPWPDCGKIKRRRSTTNSIKMPYYSGTCPDSNIQVEIQKKFIDSFKKYALIKGLCPPESCTYENVNVTCGSHSFNRNKREILNEINDQSENTNQEDNILQFEIKWTVAIADDCKNSEDEKCEETSDELTDEEIKINLQDFQVTNLGMLSNYIPHISPVENATEFISIPNCEIGQIIRNMSCVNCPQGTFYDQTSKECLSCLVGTFQDKEATISCKQCPSGTSTVNKNAKSIEECKGSCSLGTYSETGLETCKACPIGTFQNLPGQKTCKNCTTGLTTWTIGATSLSDCTTTCPPGTYSDVGFLPCDPCPLGTYQNKSQQKECIPCPPGLTTKVEGAHILQYCTVVNICEEIKPCNNLGTCINIENNYICHCPTGFQGKQCEINIDDCSEELCLNNGTCIDGINQYSCLCVPGFTGLNCEINIDDCSIDNCLNGGTCVDGINSFVCKCPKGFTGKICDINYYDCASNPCQNGGTCFDQADGFRCCCPKEYNGKYCENKINHCDSVQCLNGGNCIEKVNEFECNCTSGFSGKYCEINDDDCNDQPCLNGGICIDEILNYTCMCPAMFQGQNCEDKKDISTNFGLQFTSEITTNYVKIYNKKPLYAITVSFWMRSLFSQENNRGTPISYSYKDLNTKKEVENALTLIDVHKFLFYLHGEKFYTDIDATKDEDWHHCAITWDSQTGDWFLYWDDMVKLKGSGMAIGRPFWSGYFVLGQEQDSIGGAFSAVESFLGEITQFNVWDHVLSYSEIKEIKGSCGFLGNIISWNDCKYNIHGKVAFIQDSDICTKNGVCSDYHCYCYKNATMENSNCWKSVPTCEPNPCANNQQCILKNSVSQCSCSAGIRRKFCQYDIDECVNNNGNCSHFCTNVIGSFMCSCPNGMKLTEDQVTCIDTSYCTNNKHIYLDGEVWPVGCENCKCDKGDITCMKRPCSEVTCLENETKMLIPGKCCYECIEETSCKIQNYQFMTFDNFIYNFSGSCRYTIVDDCVDGEFSIRYEDLSFENKEKIIYVYIHCTEVQIFPSGKILINGESIKLPYFDTFLNIILDYENHVIITVTTTHGIKLLWKSSQTIEIQVPQKYRKKVCGLCGNFNGIKDDDFFTRHHLPARTIMEFGLSWKVEGHKYCRKPPSKIPNDSKLQVITFNKCKFTSSYRLMKARKECNILKDSNFRKCHKYVNPVPYYKTCLQDSCSCSYNEPCYCDSISDYALECRRSNVFIKHWTLQTKCAFRCDGGMVYDDCGPQCHETCNPMGLARLCRNEICVPGCYCPAGKVLHNGRCILKTECPYPN
ncbi:LOW QUALITY PROTEIN: sushi, von Willebrand factor type A, EGF and pentraxin domain-containing protein 1-like [Centruroides vittatus]|uniref:LOW QUALITY PROTEIN: sushi, von Willebrand factor type A, EGF and pentraxin domain-containing protein 1-like n=1 Tax=Centruroides vittatus TaxID=120091 RepID=UPI0035105A2D